MSPSVGREVILEASRLVLREAVASDVSALREYQRDPRYLEHYPQPPDPLQIVVRSTRWARESPRLNFQFVIARGASEPTIGCAGVRRAGAAPGEAEVGIELNPEYWGRGYATDTLERLIDFARQDLELVTLLASSSPTNRRAHELLRRVGFSRAPSARSVARFSLSLAAV